MRAALLEELREDLDALVHARRGRHLRRGREPRAVKRRERGDGFRVERELLRGEEIREERVERGRRGRGGGGGGVGVGARGRPGAVDRAREEHDVAGDLARGGVPQGWEPVAGGSGALEEASGGDAEGVILAAALRGGVLHRADQVAPRPGGRGRPGGARRVRSTRVASPGGRRGRGVVPPAPHDSAARFEKVPFTARGLRSARRATERRGGGAARSPPARVPGSARDRGRTQCDRGVRRARLDAWSALTCALESTTTHRG